MNEKWEAMIERFEEEGYTPHDIQRMVLLYEMIKKEDEKIKDSFDQEENEEAPFYF